MDPSADTAPSWQPRPLPRSARVYVAGHGGLVGSAVWRHLEAQGFTDLVGRTSAELDLRERDDVVDFFAKERPEVVVAGRRPGRRHPGQRDATRRTSSRTTCGSRSTCSTPPPRHGVERLLFLGSSCIYPKLAPQPIREDALLTGPLEPTNDAYAIAKIAGVLQVQALRRQHGLPCISRDADQPLRPRRQLLRHRARTCCRR